MIDYAALSDIIKRAENWKNTQFNYTIINVPRANCNFKKEKCSLRQIYFKHSYSHIGKYDFSDITKAHTAIKKDYGDIVRFSGMEPRRDMVMVYTAEDIETVFRHEGIWPERPSLQCMNYYRTVARKDFFKGVGGILNEYLFKKSRIVKCH